PILAISREIDVEADPREVFAQAFADARLVFHNQNAHERKPSSAHGATGGIDPDGPDASRVIEEPQHVYLAVAFLARFRLDDSRVEAFLDHRNRLIERHARIGDDDTAITRWAGRRLSTPSQRDARGKRE